MRSGPYENFAATASSTAQPFVTETQEYFDTFLSVMLFLFPRQLPLRHQCSNSRCFLVKALLKDLWLPYQLVGHEAESENSKHHAGCAIRELLLPSCKQESCTKAASVR